MKILALDTATKSCSIAVVDKESLLAEVTIVKEQTHSKHLMDIIDWVMGMSALKISELDGVAVTKGPGTFTGLRIGISSAKGLAMAAGIPIVGVSSLEALAMQAAPSQHLICPLLDARRSEVYFSRYRFQKGRLIAEIEENVSTPAEAVSDIDEPCIFIGNGAWLYHDSILDKMGELAHFAPSAQHTIRASTVAVLGMDKFKNVELDDGYALLPHYIRKSDAELNRQKKNM
jgi:tRNA threonylcarbamoyladenosine biosynthesis protein TsaB